MQTVRSDVCPQDAPLTSFAVPSVLKASEEPIHNAIDTVSKLAQAASKQPYYKFNSMWSRQVQDAVCSYRTSNQTSTDMILATRHPLLGLARRQRLRRERGEMRTPADTRGAWRDPERYFPLSQLRPILTSVQCLRTLRTETSSTSPSKSTFSLSPRLSRSWYVPHPSHPDRIVH
jgi:hypothetical protein